MLPRYLFTFEDELPFTKRCQQCQVFNIHNQTVNNHALVHFEFCIHVLQQQVGVRIMLSCLEKSTIDDVDLSDDSDSERIKHDENRVFRGEHKRRRHDKSTCLLCSAKPNAVSDRTSVRSRRTSTSSIHRIRTGMSYVFDEAVESKFVRSIVISFLSSLVPSLDIVSFHHFLGWL